MCSGPKEECSTLASAATCFEVGLETAGVLLQTIACVCPQGSGTAGEQLEFHNHWE